MLALLFAQFFDLYDLDKIESLVPIARLARKIIPSPSRTLLLQVDINFNYRPSGVARVGRVSLQRGYAEDNVRNFGIMSTLRSNGFKKSIHGDRQALRNFRIRIKLRSATVALSFEPCM